MTPAEEPAYRFCPMCGGALERRLLKAGEPERLVCVACRHIVYLDPKLAVGTIITMDDDRVVLVRRAIEPGYGKWVFPGGYVDRGEEIRAAAIREALEEAGLTVRLDGLVSIYSYAGRAPVIVVYAATATGGALRHCDESLEIQLFARDELPWDELAFHSTREALRDYLDGHLHRHGFL
jgi:ADP-ribose pyrophosphatase YjhB (NUDIX family)